MAAPEFQSADDQSNQSPGGRNQICRLGLRAGGVGDLARVVGVLALLDVTPVSFRARPDDPYGLQIEIVIDVAEQLRDSCLARIGRLPAVHTLSCEVLS